MKKRVAVIGACGRMGQLLVRQLNFHHQLSCVAAVESKDHAQFGSMQVFGGEAFDIVSLENIENEKIDVVIDFSGPEASLQALAYARKKGSAFVSGTTGFTDEQMDCLAKASLEIPLLYASNMSIGITIMNEVLRYLATFTTDYDCEIVEAHHKYKKDAPSGTALTLGRTVASARNVDFDTVALLGRAGNTGERTEHAIGFHAVRGGDVTGDHSVLFLGDGERIELKHVAHQRDILASGAVRAAEWISQRKEPGLYSMLDVLGIKIDNN